jgi:hypothetical protein
VNTRARLAFAVFAAIEAVGAVLYVVNGRRVWFFGVFGDEWDFLAGRRLTLHDLLLRHGDHLVALPALAFRVLYGIVGLRSYLPYQLLAIALHLAAAALLRVVMRRAGVGPWIATAAAGLFVLFGAGSQDILIAFQITFTGALVFGLTQLLLADHDGSIDRRDALGLLAGLAALLCSDVAIVMIAAVGISCVVRKRWRAAALHTAPLAAVYVAWLVGFGRGARTSYGFAQVTKSARTSVSATFDALGQVPFVGWALAAMLVIGLVIAVRDTDPTERWPRFSAVVALLIGAALFASMLAVTRFGLGPQFAASSRYLHIIAALLLPALAVAVDAIAQRHRALGFVAVALLLVGIPGNIAGIGDNVGPAARYRAQRRVITGLPRAPLAETTPRSLRPTPSFAAEVTVGWLLAGARSGRIPATRDLTPREQAGNVLRLSLEQLERPAFGCVPLRGQVTRRLTKDDTLGVRGAVAVQLLPNGSGVPSQVLPFGTSLLATSLTHTLRAVRGPLTLRIAPRSPVSALC